ncbi:MAG: hypothetical protein A3I83_09140 [Methylotenera sp. RIFCSPLOWO2_02_FULL_45_14]|nr:MAG: hypothetical protein A3I83_09140 [Methylotenera sp. RIFCSPLOWO2_02_FULL_45_14]
MDDRLVSVRLSGGMVASNIDNMVCFPQIQTNFLQLNTTSKNSGWRILVHIKLIYLYSAISL